MISLRTGTASNNIIAGEISLATRLPHTNNIIAGVISLATRLPHTNNIIAGVISLATRLPHTNNMSSFLSLQLPYLYLHK